MAKAKELPPTSPEVARHERVKQSWRKRRLGWMQSGLQTRNAAHYTCDGEVHHFPGGRKCVCGRITYHAFVLQRTEGPLAGIDIYLGPRCAVTALAYITGGLSLNGQKEE